MNDDQYFLANAYLDGELADDERRIAEADPAVMAEVEVLRDLQADLREVDAPTAAARESAIGAAMAEFAARDSVVTPPAAAAAPVVPFRPKPAYSRFLGIAAAVVAVGVLGVVVVNGVGGGGDNDASMAEPSALDEADAADDGSLRTADRDVIESVTPTDLENATAAIAAEEATGDAAGDMADSEMAEEEVAADDGSAEMSEGAGDIEAAEPAADADTFRDVDVAYDTGASTTSERPVIDVEAPITNDAELGAYGTYLLELENERILGSLPNTKCDASYNILSAAKAIINDVETTVYIAVQEDDERVIGLDFDNCEELVDGPLFPRTNP